ncbi:WYL domain-containing protein [Pacificibacter maritimus]|uniref:WYL domain-containing protein n=1 Tax=Pacificibacter maritimus TaxID=762213 RepID=A0A3N4VDV2_9RHOB|nr:YafY family protein [Pacificibacter maritimus]RPE71114.1 WYL domain-containing protein [Pacificibacter maritimus]
MTGRKQSAAQRSDRLMALIQILRDGELHKARDLGDALAVTPRTIWRDMATLRASGLPVDGTPGAGYRVTAQVTLPPLNLSMGEFEALHLAVAILTEATDPELAKSAQSLAVKIDAALPENTGPPSTQWGFAIHPFADTAAGFKHMPLLRDAVRNKKLIRISFLSEDGAQSTELIHPLQLNYWGRVWTMVAWCRSQRDFCEFRVDRIQSLIDTGATFDDEVGTGLDDFLKLRQAPNRL